MGDLRHVSCSGQPGAGKPAISVAVSIVGPKAADVVMSSPYAWLAQ